MHERRSPAPLPFCVAAIALLAGCGNTYVGDPPSTPLANAYGPGDRLCTQLAPEVEDGGVPFPWVDPADVNSTKCSGAVPPDRKMSANGLTIVAIDNYDETGKGAVGNYYVQDSTCAGKPYSGATVFGPSFSPPDLRLAVGDVVDVTGSIGEFIGPSSGRFAECATLPEIAGTLSFRFDNAGLPEPVVIPVSDLKAYRTARQWLGMVVKIEDVKLNSATASGGRCQLPIDVGGGSSIDIPKVTNELVPIDCTAITDGTHFTSITGVVTYFYGWHLVPRSADDLVQ